MKKICFAVIFSIFQFSLFAAVPPNTLHIMVAPATITAHEATLLWDKVSDSRGTYEITVNRKHISTADKTYFTLEHLSPSTKYTVEITVTGNTAPASVIQFTTTAEGKIFNILDYGAKPIPSFSNTKAIQQAINACTPGGTVLVPKGTFVTGALFLKSNMTLNIEKDGVLKGSADTSDYLPQYLNRFEGWELNTYASLINAGKLNRDGIVAVENLRITGAGTIEGGGQKLGKDMVAARGIRSRGRLFCLMNCRNISITQLNIKEPPSWTIHYIYSKQITLAGLTISTYGIANGDGIDPDSSDDSYIFNCTFDTGDDCIAIKSGKNPEGFLIGKPTTNVRIMYCNFVRGHGISIGSEMSGGVSDVLVQDCKAGALINGMQIKGTKERGGYVRNVTVVDCQLMKITVFSKLNYNNDGEGAPTPPIFENFVFKNIDLTKANTKEPVININGFSDEKYKLRNVKFINLAMPDNAKAIINDAADVVFKNVVSAKGAKPEYVVNNSSGIEY